MLTRSHSNTIETPKVNGPEKTMAATGETLTIADLLKEIRQGNKKTEQQLSELDKTLKDNKKTIEDYIVKNDEVVNKLRSELDETNKEKTQKMIILRVLLHQFWIYFFSNIYILTF